MSDLEQKLYDQAVYDATFQDDNISYTQYIEKLQKSQERKFLEQVGAPTSAEKEAFAKKLNHYLTCVIHAHNSFVRNGGTLNAKGELVFKNHKSADEFDRFVDQAANANLDLYNTKKAIKEGAYHRVTSSQSQEEAYKQAQAKYRKSEDRKEKGKGLLKGLGIAALAGGVLVGAYKGTKAVMDNLPDSNEDFNRIEHRVDVVHHDAGVRQGVTMDFATDKDGTFVRTQRVAPQRPTVDNSDVNIVEIQEEEVIEQTEEFTQPQLPEIVEEVHVQPQPQQIVEQVVQTPTPVVHQTIEEIQEQVEQNTVVYQQTMTPTTTTIVQEPVVVQSPAPVVHVQSTPVVVGSTPVIDVIHVGGHHLPPRVVHHSPIPHGMPHVVPHGHVKPVMPHVVPHGHVGKPMPHGHVAPKMGVGHGHTPMPMLHGGRKTGCLPAVHGGKGPAHGIAPAVRGGKTPTRLGTPAVSGRRAPSHGLGGLARNAQPRGVFSQRTPRTATRSVPAMRSGASFRGGPSGGFRGGRGATPRGGGRIAPRGGGRGGRR